MDKSAFTINPKNNIGADDFLEIRKNRDVFVSVLKKFQYRSKARVRTLTIGFHVLNEGSVTLIRPVLLALIILSQHVTCRIPKKIRLDAAGLFFRDRDQHFSGTKFLPFRFP